MSMQDPISDMLTQIRNAQKANKETVTIPASNHKAEILRVLAEEGYIESYEKTADAKPQLTVKLRYFHGGPVMRTIKRVSKPSLRIYKQNSEIEPVKDGLGVNIISTSKGVMTDKSAKDAGLGGEILCEIF